MFLNISCGYLLLEAEFSPMSYLKSDLKDGSLDMERTSGMRIVLGLVTTLFLLPVFSAPRVSYQPQSTIDLKAELTGKDIKKMNDSQLYAELLLQYQRGDLLGMKRTLEVLLKKFVSSPHADNALYIMGYASLEKKRFAEGLNYFQRLLKDYPNSNKAVSAEFAKGLAYRSMKLTDLAQQTFYKVRKKYPGSPEYYRAESELKLLARR